MGSNTIPDEYTEIDHNPLEADFYRELSQIYQKAKESDAASSVYLHPSLPATGMGSNVYVFNEPPHQRTVYQTMAECFDGFPEELAGDAEASVTTSTDTIGAEWHINIPDPDWYPESGFSDVTRLEVINGVVLATVVCGPTTGDTHPRKRARHLAAEMRSRVREEVTGPDE